MFDCCVKDQDAMISHNVEYSGLCATIVEDYYFLNMMKTRVITVSPFGSDRMSSERGTQEIISCSRVILGGLTAEHLSLTSTTPTFQFDRIDHA